MYPLYIEGAIEVVSLQTIRGDQSAKEAWDLLTIRCHRHRMRSPGHPARGKVRDGTEDASKRNTITHNLYKPILWEWFLGDLRVCWNCWICWICWIYWTCWICWICWTCAWGCGYDNYGFGSGPTSWRRRARLR